jgi:hypothetical protein
LSAARISERLERVRARRFLLALFIGIGEIIVIIVIIVVVVVMAGRSGKHRERLQHP